MLHIVGRPCLSTILAATRMDIDKLKAEAGSVVAQGVLGIGYLYGLDTPKDYAGALHWLTSAAGGGTSRPTFHLGRMHEEGWGVPVDYKRAGQLYQKAADLGEWLAYIHLARQATPDCALLFIVAQVSGAPDAVRWATCQPKNVGKHRL